MEVPRDSVTRLRSPRDWTWIWTLCHLPPEPSSQGTDPCYLCNCYFPVNAFSAFRNSRPSFRISYEGNWFLIDWGIFSFQTCTSFKPPFAPSTPPNQRGVFVYLQHLHWYSPNSSFDKITSVWRFPALTLTCSLLIPFLFPIQLFSQSHCDKHWSCFRYFVTPRKAAMNKLEPISFYTSESISVDKLPEVEL